MARRKPNGIKKKGHSFGWRKYKYLAYVSSNRTAEILPFPIANTGKDSRPTGRWVRMPNRDCCFVFVGSRVLISSPQSDLLTEISWFYSFTPCRYNNSSYAKTASFSIPSTSLGLFIIYPVVWLYNVEVFCKLIKNEMPFSYPELNEIN
jgi:hypothetical protein